MKKSFLAFFALLYIVICSLSLFACSYEVQANYAGTYYLYDYGKKTNVWIMLENDKWSASNDSNGRLEVNDGIVTAYRNSFDEEYVVFTGKVDNGTLTCNYLDETEYKLYKDGAYKDDESSDMPYEPDKPSEPDDTGEIAYIRVNENGEENDNGKYVLFGLYPQTKVTDETLIATLNSLAETLPTEDNRSDEWLSYDYFFNDDITDFMWYIDKEYNGKLYRGVYFTSYRPYCCDYSVYSNNTYQDDNGYYTSTVYWFKYEPIKWIILKETDGNALILADLALDGQQYYHSKSAYIFDEQEIYANNYSESDIRRWLNYTFYNAAFNSLEKKSIKITNVSNSVNSTGYNNNDYACGNTLDNVFLLSYKQTITYLTSDTERQMKSSDYAKSQGAYVSSVNGDTCWWWLRSPYDCSGSRARYVDIDGQVSGSDRVDSVYLGVVPALWIRLS